MSRQGINRAIIAKLTALNESTPNLRFGQMLAITKIITYKDVHDLGPEAVPEVIDPFYEESIETLNRIEKSNI